MFVPSISCFLLVLVIFVLFSAVLFLILDSWSEILNLNIGILRDLIYCFISYLESFNELTMSSYIKGGIRLVCVDVEGIP